MTDIVAHWESQPIADPQTLKDGSPHVHLTKDGVKLYFEDREVFIPNVTINRGGITISPGDSRNLNMVTITLHACLINVDEDVPDQDRILVQRSIRSLAELTGA